MVNFVRNVMNTEKLHDIEMERKAKANVEFQQKLKLFFENIDYLLNIVDEHGYEVFFRKNKGKEFREKEDNSFDINIPKPIIEISSFLDKHHDYDSKLCIIKNSVRGSFQISEIVQNSHVHVGATHYEGYGSYDMDLVFSRKHITENPQIELLRPDDRKYSIFVLDSFNKECETFLR